MIALICFVLAVLASPFKSKCRLEAENAALRHQLIVLRRKMPGWPWLTNNDRWFFLQMYRWFPSILKVVRIIQPETLVRWHRAGFRCYWRWKSLGRGGRPQIETHNAGSLSLHGTDRQLHGYDQGQGVPIRCAAHAFFTCNSWMLLLVFTIRRTRRGLLRFSGCRQLRRSYQTVPAQLRIGSW